CTGLEGSLNSFQTAKSSTISTCGHGASSEEESSEEAKLLLAKSGILICFKSCSSPRNVSQPPSSKMESAKIAGSLNFIGVSPCQKTRPSDYGSRGIKARPCFFLIPSPPWGRGLG